MTHRHLMTDAYVPTPRKRPWGYPRVADPPFDMAVRRLYREIYRDVPRCLFFTRDSDDYVKNQCVFTWFVKVMVLTMVFELFSLSFPMDFHGEGFWESPCSS